MDDESKVVPLKPEWQARFDERFAKGPDVERRLWRAIHNDDDIGFILRVHLLFEYGLNSALEKRGTKVGDLKFRQKLTAAAHAGLITMSMSDTIAAINQLRNKYAHRLDYALTDDDAERIFQLAVVSSSVDPTHYREPRSRLREIVPFIWNAFRLESDAGPFFADIDANEE